MGQAKGGKKLRRCAKKAPYYKQQFFRTEANKARRARKRARRKDHWEVVKAAAQPAVLLMLLCLLFMGCELKPENGGPITKRVDVSDSTHHVPTHHPVEVTELGYATVGGTSVAIIRVNYSNSEFLGVQDFGLVQIKPAE